MISLSSTLMLGRTASSSGLIRGASLAVRRYLATVSATCQPDCAGRAESDGATLMDAPLRISAAGLTPGAPVTLGLDISCPEERVAFSSKAMFTASEKGEVDCEKDAAIEGGSYKGVDPMGLFTWMRPADQDAVNSGKLLDVLMVRNTDRDMDFNLRVWEGHQVSKNDQPPLASCNIRRRYFFPSRVRRSPLRQGRVRGTLFTPIDGASGGRSPLVITVYGGVLRGAVIEEKAAVLASYGFSTLALAFYGVEDLPKRYGGLDALDVEYFEEAIEAAASQEGVDGSRVAFMGNSKGGDLTLSCVAFLGSKIRSAIILNSCIASVATKTTYKDQVVNAIGFKEMKPENLKYTEDGQIDILGILNPLYDDIEAIPPFYKSKDSSGVELLFQAGDDDHNFESAMYAREAGRLMEEAGRGDRCTVEILEGLGHICHLPYSPGSYDALHALAPPGMRLYMGGDKDKEAHLRGQKRAWQGAIEFLERTLK